MQADYDGTMLKLQYTKIRAPHDGTIGRKMSNQANLFSQGKVYSRLFRTIYYGSELTLKETQVENVRIGLPVEISVDAYPGIKWTGHVEKIAPTSGSKLNLFPPENATGNFTKVVQRIPVRIKIDSDSTAKLKPGMSVTAVIVIPH